MFHGGYMPRPPADLPEPEDEQAKEERNRLEAWRLAQLFKNFPDTGVLTFEEIHLLEQVAASTADIRRFADLVSKGATASQAARILL